MARRRPQESITVRGGLDFGLLGCDLPRYWLDGDPYRTRVMDAVQATFPEGERYFIATVRAYVSQIRDPALAQQVRDFIGQEGQHGRVHRAYNDRLAQQGLHIDFFSRVTRAVTHRLLRHRSAGYNVAITAALEHFTAMMADLFFAEKAVTAGADERMRAIFAWHAIEEMEHRAVAFDVMQQVAGVGYATRVLAMTYIATAFLSYLLFAPWCMLRMEGLGVGACLRFHLRGLRWMWGWRGVVPRLLPRLARYYRPGFHPHQETVVHNYRAWVAAFEATRDPVAASRAMYAAAT